jgi:sec-independent protein translocase protein TatA
MGSIGVTELLVIFVILVLLFGASKIPQLGKGLGEGIKNFKKGLKGDEPGADSDPAKRA